jgi:uncharacterized protein (DUF952 family)
MSAMNPETFRFYKANPMANPMANPVRVFKICSLSDWAQAKAIGAFRGSADDQRDGYIHLSTAEQATETARKYFSNRQDLLLVAFDATALGALLRWEPSRGGALFPHYYADLPTALAQAAEPLELGIDGTPDVTAALARIAA